MNIPIKYTDKGLAYFCEEKGKKWIELNKHLPEFPELHDLILKHELGHDNKNKIDFLYEIKDLFNFKKQRMIKEFLKKYPEARPSLKPISKIDGVIEVNWFNFMFWLGLCFILAVIVIGVALR